ncbi:TPA: hypothetical protein RNH74_002362 [Yersinia enterocolitica]|uniref:hypothetical protein n=1 Tax=Yersinia enterocolitica TaxID=630 RepID=UPI0005E05B33|nr:hypothetical protein [Yersinia enterocolitica]CQD47153.1 Uncharacterised protein [Yersinia enterocolitica]HDL8301778.1 hypothetical protein [Yersinia enterocolitica]HDW9412385.1 hypothetical protein [Yersinia enterocolitica]
MHTLTKNLEWSPDGCHVEILPAGEYEKLPARALVIASQLNILELVDLQLPEQKADAQPEQPEQPEQLTAKKGKK